MQSGGVAGQGARRGALWLCGLSLVLAIGCLVLGWRSPRWGLEELVHSQTRRDMQLIYQEFPYPDDILVCVRGAESSQRERFLGELEETLAATPERFPSRLWRIELRPLGRRLLQFLPARQLEEMAEHLERWKAHLAPGQSLLDWVAAALQEASPGSSRGLGAFYREQFLLCLESRGSRAPDCPLQKLLESPQWRRVEPIWSGRAWLPLTLDEGQTHVMLLRPGRADALDWLRPRLHEALRRNPELEAELTGNAVVAAEQWGSLHRHLQPLVTYFLLVMTLALVWRLLAPRRALAAICCYATVLVGGAGLCACTLGFGPLLATELAMVALLLGYGCLLYGFNGDRLHIKRLALVSLGAFAVLGCCQLAPAARLGRLASLHLALALVATLLLLPSWEQVLECGVAQPSGPDNPPGWLIATLPGRRLTRILLALTTLLALLCLTQLRPQKFQADLLAAADPNLPALRAERQLQSRGRTSLFALLLARDEAQARRLSEGLVKMAGVEEVIALPLFVPSWGEAKARAIARMVACARQAHPPQEIPLGSAEQLGQLARKLETRTAGVAGKDGSQLRRALRGLGPGQIQDSLSVFQKAFLKDIRRILEILKSQTHLPFEPRELQPEARERLVSDSGRQAVLVFPRQSPGDSSEAFVTRLSEYLKTDPPLAWAGPARVTADLSELTRAATRTFPTYLGLGLVLSLTLVLRSPIKASLVALGPGLALLFTYAVLALYGLPLNFLTWPAPAITMLLGTSIALQTLRRPRASLRALFPAFALLGGCLVLMASQHPGLAGLGFVAGLGIAFNLLIAILLLPSLQALGRWASRRFQLASSR